MNYNFLGGIGLILLGGIIIFLKIKKKWTYKFDEDTASNKILTYKGWFGAISSVVAGIIIVIQEIIKNFF